MQLFPRIKIDYDYIEVANNQFLKLSSRAYVPCPFSDEEFGFITPRSYHDFDPSRTTIHGGYLASAMEYWFPNMPDLVDLAHRIYQCFLCHQLPDKTRKLTLVGEIDSGKTSLMNFFLGIIPEQKIAVITKESTFGLSMITPDTELLNVDEWTKEMTSADLAKMLFQGGAFPQSVKFQTPRRQKMEAGVFISCNKLPDFGADQKAVERRLAVFYTKPLLNLDPAAPTWIKKNSIHCLTYLMNLVNDNLNLLDKNDLAYTLPVDVRCTTTVIKENFDEKKKNEIQNCILDESNTVELADDHSNNLEMFRLEEGTRYIFIYLHFYMV